MEPVTQCSRHKSELRRSLGVVVAGQIQICRKVHAKHKNHVVWALQLKVLVELIEDPGLVSNTHGGSHVI